MTLEDMEILTIRSPLTDEQREKKQYNHNVVYDSKITVTHIGSIETIGLGAFLESCDEVGEEIC